MSRDKSVNEIGTKEGTRYYYREAKEKGLLPALMANGVSEGAIRTTMSRGHISQKVIDGFVRVLGADEDVLTGRKPVSEITEIEWSYENAEDFADKVIQELFDDESLGIPCRKLILRVMRYVKFVSLSQKREKGSGIDFLLLKERGLIDKAFSEIAQCITPEIKENNGR